METACSQKCLDLDSMAFAHREGHTFLGGYAQGPKLSRPNGVNVSTVSEIQ